MSQKSNPTCRIWQSGLEIRIYRGEFDEQDTLFKSTLEDSAIKRQNSNLPWRIWWVRDENQIDRGGFDEQGMKIKSTVKDLAIERQISNPTGKKRFTAHKETFTTKRQEVFQFST